MTYRSIFDYFHGCVRQANKTGGNFIAKVAFDERVFDVD